MRKPPEENQSRRLHEGNTLVVHVVIIKLQSGHSDGEDHVVVSEPQLEGYESEPIEYISKHLFLGNMHNFSHVKLRERIADVQESFHEFVLP